MIISVWNPEAGDYQEIPALRGSDGRGFRILGYYASAADLQAGVQAPSAGDAYGVGTAAPYDIHIWDGITGSWVNNGALQGVKGDTGDTGPKGEKGDTGPQGPKGDTGDTGSQGPKGEKGDTGAAGHTPEKGVDYFTAEDKQALVQQVLAALPAWTGGSY